MAEPAAAQRFLVSGRVQGVGFRVATQTQAQSLGLVGWVRNLPDGRVETLACGSAQQLAAFASWLEHGPRLARVDELERVPAAAPGVTEFRCLPTPLDYP